MKVTIINYTKGARELLIFSKRTRLKMSPNAFQEILEMGEEEKQKELEYVFGTINSSWEFVDYTILIEDVTRAFTHQLVRHRVGVSFAQQSQRTVDMSNFKYLASGKCKNNSVYKKTMAVIKASYENLILNNVAPQDARGILPTNIFTNILMKINLRALADMMKQRLCSRAQEEFRDVMGKIKKEIFKVHSWTERILKCYCDINKKCYFKNGKGCGKYAE